MPADAPTGGDAEAGAGEAAEGPSSEVSAAAALDAAAGPDSEAAVSGQASTEDEPASDDTGVAAPETPVSGEASSSDAVPLEAADRPADEASLPGADEAAAQGEVAASTVAADPLARSDTPPADATAAHRDAGATPETLVAGALAAAAAAVLVSSARAAAKAAEATAAAPATLPPPPVSALDAALEQSVLGRGAFPPEVAPLPQPELTASQAPEPSPAASPIPATPLDEALDRGDLRAAGSAAASVLMSGGDLDVAHWCALGALNTAKRRTRDAQRCFERAVAANGSAALALRVFASTHLESGDPYGAAMALAALIDDNLPDTPRAERCARVGALLAEGGGRWLAEGWLETALALRPNDREVAGRLLELYAARRDAGAVTELADRFVMSPASGKDGAAWLLRLAKARVLLEDEFGAAAELRAAFQLDPVGQSPAIRLLELGLEAGRDDWTAEAAEELAHRALEAGDRARASAASAIWAAVAGPAAGAGALHISVRPGPTLSADDLWTALDAGAESIPLPPSGRPASAPRAEPRDDPALRPIADEVRARLDTPGVRVCAVAGASTAVPGLNPTVFVGPDLGRSEAACRFGLARLIAAASRPRLAAAVTGPRAAAVADLLDRFAALAFPDPAGAFEMVGPDPHRRRLLALVWLQPE